MDEEETLKMSEGYVKKTSLGEYYNLVVIPALNLAEEDRHNGTLAEHRQKFILQNVSELIETIGEDENEVSDFKNNSDKSKQFTAICIPCRDETDELAAKMLSQLLKKDHVSTSVIECLTPLEETYAFLQAQQPKIICISSLPPFALNPARQMYQN